MPSFGGQCFYQMPLHLPQLLGGSEPDLGLEHGHQSETKRLELVQEGPSRAHTAKGPGRSVCKWSSQLLPSCPQDKPQLHSLGRECSSLPPLFLNPPLCGPTSFQERLGRAAGQVTSAHMSTILPSTRTDEEQ